ncbi:MAG TPA: amidohydrolase family protein [bacterium]|nr:amidohydrolase family protein [bacterium]
MDRRDFLKSSVAAGGLAWAAEAGAREGRGAALLKRVRLVDPETGRSDERASDIRMEHGRILEIAPAGELASGGMAVIEGHGRFALPGLIDCHVHSCGFFMTEMPGAGDFPWMLRQIGLNYRASLASGVTTFRDMAAPLKLILIMRDRTRDPRSGYPKLKCCGPILTVANGYPPHVPPDEAWMRALLGALRVELHDRRDAEKWVDRLAQAGVDWIKIAYSSMKYDAARSVLAVPSPELFRAIVERAHHHDIPVAVHHTWLKDLQKLADLPFDTLEHLTGDQDIDPATLDKLAGRGLPITTNLEVFDMIVHPEKTRARIEAGDAPLMPKAQKCLLKLLDDIEKGEDLYVLKPPILLFGIKSLLGTADQEARNLKLLHGHGIRIGAATDAGLPLPFGSLPHEMCHMGRAGLPPAAVLRSATSDAARLLRIDDIGRIKNGFQADIVLYDSDPLMDLEALKRPGLVIRDGVVASGG